jgi:hypothetical protein
MRNTRASTEEAAVQNLAKKQLKFTPDYGVMYFYFSLKKTLLCSSYYSVLRVYVLEF